MRWHWLPIVAAVAGGATHPAAAGEEESPRSVRGEYARLRDAGCDPAALGIATPIEARVLRNVPYAEAGQRFASEELRALYAADGAWYQPRTPRVKVAARDARCVAKLARHEAKLRKQLPIDKAVEAVLTRDPKVFWGLRDSVRYPNRYRKAASRASEREWFWRFEDSAACGGDGGPESAGDCSSFMVTCEVPEQAKGDWAALRCELSWAG